MNLPPASAVSSHTPSALRNGHSTTKAPSSVDHLRKLLMKSMNSSHAPNFFGEWHFFNRSFIRFATTSIRLGMCARCNDEILGEENGLVAMDRMYHVACFTCTMCGSRLRGMHFYSMENQPYCESCYVVRVLIECPCYGTSLFRLHWRNVLSALDRLLIGYGISFVLVFCLSMIHHCLAHLRQIRVSIIGWLRDREGEKLLLARQTWKQRVQSKVIIVIKNEKRPSFIMRH